MSAAREWRLDVDTIDSAVGRHSCGASPVDLLKLWALEVATPVTAQRQVAARAGWTDTDSDTDRDAALRRRPTV